MRFTLCIFVLFLVAHAWGFNHAKNTLPMARERVETCPMQRGDGPTHPSNGQAGRNVPALPAPAWPGQAEAAPIVPEGTHWVLDTGQALDTVDDSAAERIRVCNENANCITF